MSTSPHRVVVAGGGIAGLEALLALHALAGDRVELTLVSAREDFVYRPMAVARPFALGHARHTPLTAVAQATGATLKIAGLEAVDPASRTVATSDGDLEYDELVLAVGAKAEPAYARATTWDDRSDADTLGGLLRDLEEGYSSSLAIVIPPGPGWPLPAYELALLIGGQARGMGIEPKITLVTPERAPLAIFGPRAVEAVTEDLAAAGIAVETGAYAELSPGHATTVHLRPSDRSFEVGRVLALPRLQGRAIAGIPADADGFVEVDEHCRVRGVPGVWAAGDGIAFPVKFGGLATQQADAAAEDIAHQAGVPDEPRPFKPVLRGQLLTGRTQRWMRFAAAGGEGDGETATHALWWPPGKVAGRYLAPWLSGRDDEAVAGEVPQAGGMPVQMDLHRSFVASR
ncbi:MAG: FAD-dependent oxidoreductase [Solirubrobacteraceae bacterium]